MGIQSMNGDSHDNTIVLFMAIRIVTRLAGMILYVLIDAREL